MPFGVTATEPAPNPTSIVAITVLVVVSITDTSENPNSKLVTYAKAPFGVIAIPPGMAIGPSGTVRGVTKSGLLTADYTDKSRILSMEIRVTVSSFPLGILIHKNKVVRDEECIFHPHNGSVKEKSRECDYLNPRGIFYEVPNVCPLVSHAII